MSFLSRVAKQTLRNPPFMFFAVCITPVLLTAYQIRPASPEEYMKDFKKRYGYQAEQYLADTRAANAVALNLIWENRHKPISSYTLSAKETQLQDTQQPQLHKQEAQKNQH